MGVIWLVHEMHHRVTVEVMKSASFSPNPKRTLGVLMDDRHSVTITTSHFTLRRVKTSRVAGVGHEAYEPVLVTVIAVENTFTGTYVKVTLPVLIDRCDPVIEQAFRVIRVVMIVCKCPH